MTFFIEKNRNINQTTKQEPVPVGPEYQVIMGQLVLSDCSHTGKTINNYEKSVTLP